MIAAALIAHLWLAVIPAQGLAGVRRLAEAGENDAALAAAEKLLEEGRVARWRDDALAASGWKRALATASGPLIEVLGLSDRWRQEGLGPTRSEIAKAAPAPTIFVRRGLRPGALAPRGDVTRFTWSSPGAPGLSLG